MMRWLDPLGPLKWPSLLLVASPLAAYPFWSPEPEAAAPCGLVAYEGRLFRAFRQADGSAVILRPTTAAGPAAALPRAPQPTGFDAGGAVVSAADPALRALACAPAAAP